MAKITVKLNDIFQAQEVYEQKQREEKAKRQQEYDIILDDILTNINEQLQGVIAYIQNYGINEMANRPISRYFLDNSKFNFIFCIDEFLDDVNRELTDTGVQAEVSPENSLIFTLQKSIVEKFSENS